MAKVVGYDMKPGVHGKCFAPLYNSLSDTMLFHCKHEDGNKSWKASFQGGSEREKSNGTELRPVSEIKKSALYYICAARKYQHTMV